MAFECSTPGAIIARWLSSLKGRKEKEESLESGSERRDKSRRRRKGRLSGRQKLHVSRSRECPNPESSETHNQENRTIGGLVSTVQLKNDATFNLGAGFIFAFLLASSKSELNKMKELRLQMESLVQNAKNEFQSIGKVSKSSKASRVVECSTTEVQESINSNGYFSYKDQTPYEKLVPLEIYHQDVQSGRHKKERCHVDRKEMEGELESELKHLQVLCESGSWSRHSRGGDKEYQENSISEVNAVLNKAQEHDGVLPEQLALRLYEVLEARHEERIHELEAALQQALQKLEEKETEACWWKDTAQLFSLRLPDSSRHAFKQKLIRPVPHCSMRSINLEFIKENL